LCHDFEGMPRLVFGPFEFNTATLELRRSGAVSRLQSQPAQVLRALLENSGQIVSRDQLRQAVWGDSTFVDFESGLNFCISQLRSALHDSSTRSLYIRTVPRQGYQFIAPVRALDPQEVPVVLAPVEPRAPRRKFALATALVALVILLAVAALAIHRRAAGVHAASPVVGVVRFDNETGNPAFDSFAGNVTDELVGLLASRGDGLYRVAGNARILFAPREQRDLRSIASTLNASYIVLGQVQTSGDQIRVLAHLIRASDQTHIWVVRIEGPAAGMAQRDTQIADQIATTFLNRLSSDPGHAPSFQPGSH